MQLPAAKLENALANAEIAVHANIALTDGVRQFKAVLDRSVETVGEFDLTGERRDRITVLNSVSGNFVPGMALEVDPAFYTVDEILSMPRAQWKLDRKDEDDGHVTVWWLK